MQSDDLKEPLVEKLENGRLNEKSKTSDVDVENTNECFPSLNYNTRLSGFCICFCLGLVISLGSFVWLSTGNYTVFGVFYSMGSIVSLVSTFFLVGPVKQYSKMTEECRLYASLLYVLSIFLTLFVALHSGIWLRAFWVILCVVVQFCSMLWYTASYTPFVQSAIKMCFSTLSSR